MSLPTPDITLVEQVQRGDRAAFTQLMQRHLPALLRYARGLARTPAAAEDAVQEAMLSIWRALQGDSGAQKRGEASVRAWMFTIVRHAVYRGARLRSGQPAHTEDLDTLGTQAGWGDEQRTPEEMHARMEDRACLAAALERLSPEDQEVVRLRDMEDLSGEEAAHILGVGVPTLKTRLHRARLRLKAALLQEGRLP